MKSCKYCSFALLLICLFVFIGCKKEASPANNNNTNTSQYGHVKTYADGSATIFFKYDSQGRLDSFTVDGFTDTPTYAIVYNQNTVVVSGAGNITTFALNSAGLATSDNTGNIFSFDNNGYLTSVANGNGILSYNISNGNIISKVLNNIYGQSYDSIVNTFSSKVDHRDYGLSFLGKSASFQMLWYRDYQIAKSNNLIQQFVDGETYYWTYVYDSLGRVTSETQGLAGSNNGPNLYSYTN